MQSSQTSHVSAQTWYPHFVCTLNSTHQWHQRGLCSRYWTVDCGLRSSSAELLPPHFASSHRFVIDHPDRDRTFTCSRASRSSDDQGARTVPCADSHAMPRCNDNSIPRLTEPSALLGSPLRWRHPTSFLELVLIVRSVRSS